MQHDIGPLPGELQRDFPADARAGAGDQRLLAGKPAVRVIAIGVHKTFRWGTRFIEKVRSFPRSGISESPMRPPTVIAASRAFGKW